MVAISATNSATPSLQSMLGKARLVQARNEANQAEAKAENLRNQADIAEQDAQTSQSKVRDIASRNQREDPTYQVKSSTNQSKGRFVNLSA